MGRRDNTLVEIAFYIAGHTPRVEIQDIGGNAQDLGELLDHGVLWG
jgi:hypothetical protein